MPSNSGGISVTSPHAYYSCYLKNQQKSINAFASTCLKKKKKREEERKQQRNSNLRRRALTSQIHNPSADLAKPCQQPGLKHFLQQ